MIDTLIAWQGTVEILNAQWSLDAGRTVELRLCGEAFDRVHPFKRFHQKRNGRVGTRFQAAFSHTNGQEVLAMEVMLASWKDSSSIGQSITLWLDDEVDTHPFCGCTRRKATTSGDVFALVLVELNDDDSPVDQKQSDLVSRSSVDTGVQTHVHERQGAAAGAATPGESHAQAPGRAAQGGGGPATSRKAPSKPRKFSSSVHLLVTSARFVQWLQETKGTLVKQWTPEVARQYTKKVLKVESLSDLDRDPAAVKRFHEEIRRPYERWAHQAP